MSYEDEVKVAQELREGMRGFADNLGKPFQLRSLSQVMEEIKMYESYFENVDNMDIVTNLNVEYIIKPVNGGYNVIPKTEFRLMKPAEQIEVTIDL